MKVRVEWSTEETVTYGMAVDLAGKDYGADAAALHWLAGVPLIEALDLASDGRFQLDDLPDMEAYGDEIDYESHSRDVAVVKVLTR
jgi:hypothetical protein